ncbi:hypothetical protein GCM10010435_46570 [Winogradskya consettensis]|uniref:Uncharacterized protein n=1 Tax=Winogradskya consettensis TaxID=113560 RepID=A0A919VWR5_9ACTN|nr:hypothetical protein [Actinoplanes consettensis]GIM83102.1 hypothetical protein Aco04nite_84950 [Actinoplanes consettensis]
MLSRFVDDTVTPTRHWSIPAWNAILVAGLLLSLNNAGGNPTNADELAAALGVDAIRLSIRVGGLVVLLIGVVGIRDQIRRAIAAPVIPKPRPAPALIPAATPAPASANPAGSSATVTKSAPRPVEPVPGSEGLPAADDAFWQQVRVAAATAGVVLLETTGPQDHKWRPVPAGGDVATVRATLRPGAVVTIFPAPPTNRSPESYNPVRAEKYHGLLESRETGALWYQPVDQRRLPGFLTRAGSVARWALYPVDDPARPRAVMPIDTP